MFAYRPDRARRLLLRRPRCPYRDPGAVTVVAKDGEECEAGGKEGVTGDTHARPDPTFAFLFAIRAVLQ